MATTSTTKTYIISEPTTVTTDETTVRNQVVAENLSILFEEDAFADVMSIQQRIGDPNYFLSANICELCFEAGLLARKPVMTENGRQAFLKAEKEFPLYEYSWTDEGSFSDLAISTVEALAWDLRRHPNFVHISVINEVEEVLSPLDTPAEDDTVTTEELTNQP